jgi:hypothetical protein
VLLPGLIFADMDFMVLQEEEDYLIDLMREEEMAARRQQAAADAAARREAAKRVRSHRMSGWMGYFAAVVFWAQTASRRCSLLVNMWFVIFSQATSACHDQPMSWGCCWLECCPLDWCAGELNWCVSK